MNPDKQKIAALVRDGRIRKGITQQELSDLAGISLRSVQRIESGEVLPRAYTLRVLSEKLGFSAEVHAPNSNAGIQKRLNPPVRWILTIGIGSITILATLAFIFQSPSFPETAFEAVALWTAVLGFYTLLLYRIWR